MDANLTPFHIEQDEYAIWLQLYAAVLTGLLAGNQCLLSTEVRLRATAHADMGIMAFREKKQQ